MARLFSFIIAHIYILPVVGVYIKGNQANVFLKKKNPLRAHFQTAFSSLGLG